MFIKLWYTIIIIIIIKNYIVGQKLEIFWKTITENFPEKYYIFWETFPTPHN